MLSKHYFLAYLASLQRMDAAGFSHWFWLLWVLAGLGFELYTIFNEAEGDTLSENVWALFMIQGWGKFLSWMVVAFLLWLAAHFVTRGKWG